MHRKYELCLRLSSEEQAQLECDARRCGLSKTAYLRRLILGAEIKARPTQEIKDLRTEIHHIGNNINQLAVKANTLGFVDAPQLKKEAERWHKFQADVERTFLRPDKSDMKWQ